MDSPYQFECHQAQLYFLKSIYSIGSHCSLVPFIDIQMKVHLTQKLILMKKLMTGFHTEFTSGS